MLQSYKDILPAKYRQHIAWMILWT